MSRKLVNMNIETFNDVLVSYFKGEYGSLRLGQVLCNSFIEGTWPELFYETDDKKANKMFMDFVNKKP